MRIIIIILILIDLKCCVGRTLMPKDTVYKTHINYKTNNPNQIQYPIDKISVKEIFEITTNFELSKIVMDSVLNLTMNAMSNPVEFDSLFRSFSRRTLGSGFSTLSDGTIVKEPKPFLAEWSLFKNELNYYQFVIDFMLSNLRAISYGDDGEGVQAAFYNILQTRNINIGNVKYENDVYKYIKNINSNVLNNYEKVALVTKDYFIIYVCCKDKKVRLIELLNNFNWVLIEP